MRLYKNQLIAIIFLSIFILVFATPVKVSSQEIYYDTAYKNYTHSFVDYEAARREYVLARSQYLQFKTLKSRNDARDATYKMLAARDDVMINYLTVLRERIRENPGIDETVGSMLIVKLDQEINWYTEHKAKLASAATPEDLVVDSEVAKKHFDEIAALLYEIQIIISHGKINDYAIRSADNYSRIKDKIDEIKANEEQRDELGSEKLQKIDGWLAEADSRMVRAKEKTDEAFAESINVGASRNTRPKQNYDKAIKLLEEANLYLRRSLANMKEVIRELKVTDR